MKRKKKVREYSERKKKAKKEGRTETKKSNEVFLQNLTQNLALSFLKVFRLNPIISVIHTVSFKCKLLSNFSYFIGTFCAFPFWSTTFFLPQAPAYLCVCVCAFVAHPNV